MAEYYYLVSSLPDLAPDTEPPLRLETFMENCADWLSSREMAVIAALSLTPEMPGETTDHAIALWYDWETVLRNRLARQRSGFSGQDAEAVLRHENDLYSEIESGVTDAWAQTDPQEREKVLDQVRWRFLEGLEAGHHFDFVHLCVYKIKLMLREKWLPRRLENGRANLDQTLSAVIQGGEATPIPATDSI